MLVQISTLRPKCETPEERKERKAAVKEHQRLCRAMKKETKEAGKELVSSTVIGAPLHTLAQLAGLKKINFLSIDVEGAEVAILKAFDFKALPVDVVMVECSYRAEQLQGLMDQKGFLRQARAHGDYVFLSRRATGVCGAPGTRKTSTCRHPVKVIVRAFSSATTGAVSASLHRSLTKSALTPSVHDLRPLPKSLLLSAKWALSAYTDGVSCPVTR